MSDHKKQSLREFQSRLAQRLQSTQAAAETASWLAVRSGDLRVLVPLSHASEIFPWTDVHGLPHVRPWFLGIANLRGNLTGVIDLAAYLSSAGVPDVSAPGARSAAALAQCRLFSLNPVLELNVALLVDELLGMRTVAAFVQSTPQADGMPGFFSRLYVDAQGQSWHEINLQVLSREPAFLDIHASAA